MRLPLPLLVVAAALTACSGGGDAAGPSTAPPVATRAPVATVAPSATVSPVLSQAEAGQALARAVVAATKGSGTFRHVITLDDDRSVAVLTYDGRFNAPANTWSASLSLAQDGKVEGALRFVVTKEAAYLTSSSFTGDRKGKWLRLDTAALAAVPPAGAIILGNGLPTPVLALRRAVAVGGTRTATGTTLAVTVPNLEGLLLSNLKTAIESLGVNVTKVPGTARAALILDARGAVRSLTLREGWSRALKVPKAIADAASVTTADVTITPSAQPIAIHVPVGDEIAAP